MNKKAEKIILENTVVTILFVLLFIVILIILGSWWNKFHSKGNIPAMKSLDMLQKNINLLEEGTTRSVPIQTSDKGKKYFIQGYIGLDDCEKCICVCESDECNFASESDKYCREIKYEFSGVLESENLRTYDFTLVDGIVQVRNG